MKKLIFSLIFLFTIGSFLEISASTFDVKEDCGAMAFEFQEGAEEEGWDKATANRWATVFYDLRESFNELE